jgi:hypothetical protein
MSAHTRLSFAVQTVRGASGMFATMYPRSVKGVTQPFADYSRLTSLGAEDINGLTLAVFWAHHVNGANRDEWESMHERLIQTTSSQYVQPPFVLTPAPSQAWYLPIFFSTEVTSHYHGLDLLPIYGQTLTESLQNGSAFDLRISPPTLVNGGAITVIVPLYMDTNDTAISHPPPTIEARLQRFRGVVLGCVTAFQLLRRAHLSSADVDVTTSLFLVPPTISTNRRMLIASNQPAVNAVATLDHAESSAAVSHSFTLGPHTYEMRCVPRFADHGMSTLAMVNLIACFTAVLVLTVLLVCRSFDARTLAAATVTPSRNR